MSDILAKRIEKGLIAHRELFGTTPQAIYVGVEEWKQLRKWAKDKDYKPIDDLRPKERPFFNGVGIWIVNSNSHLNFA